MHSKKPNNYWTLVGICIALSTEIVVATVAGMWLGRWVDGLWSLAPWGEAALGGLMFVFSLVHFVWVIRRISANY